MQDIHTLLSLLDSLKRDGERLDWMENLQGAGLINDDNGHWAVSETGMQTVPSPDGPCDIDTNFFVEAKEWKPTIRQALDSAISAQQKGKV